MADPMGTAPTPLPSASTSEFVATFAAVLVAIVVLLFVDEWLARLDRNESQAHAANLYSEGRQLLAAHDASAARDRFALAAAIERGNTSYELGLAEALLADGRATEAEAALQPVLDHAATNGSANLLMARVLVREKRTDEAKSFYHRAIYGQWRGDSLGPRMQARLELIALLVRQHAQGELLAELLPIQDVQPDSLALRRTLGRLFIEAGSPTRGAEILRKVLEQSPGDGRAHAAIAEAALVLGNFRSARADLEIASHLLPGDTAIANRLALADTVLALDPTQRGIGQHERAARSRRLLGIALDVNDRCAASIPAPSAALVDSARRLLAVKTTSRNEETQAAAMLSLAAGIASHGSSCGEPTSLVEQALVLLKPKLAA